LGQDRAHCPQGRPPVVSIDHGLGDPPSGSLKLTTDSLEQVGLSDAGRDSDRLQHLRRVLPCEVRVTSSVHPLFGRVLPASGFKRRNGDLLLLVVLPDGSPGTVPAEATDVLGRSAVEAITSTLSVEGVRRLRLLLGTLGLAGGSPKGTRTRK